MNDRIIEVLEIIKKECKSHSDDIADVHDRPDVCEGCPFDIGIFCFFNAGFDGRIPEEWDLEELREMLLKQQKGERK